MSAVVNRPATPLPWETRPTRSGFLGDEASMKDSGNDLNAVEPKMYGGTKIVDKGLLPLDAAYIVHAANAYPKLVTLLAECVNGTKRGCHEWNDDARRLLRELGEAGDEVVQEPSLPEQRSMGVRP